VQQGKIRAVKGIRMKATVWWAWGREGTKSKDHHTVSLDPPSSFPGSHIKGSKHPVSKSREEGLLYPQNNSTTPARDPVIQFNSDTIRKYHQIPQAKGSVLQD